MKKRDIITLMILGIIFFFILVIILINNNNEKNKNKTEYSDLTLLTNESVFLSISNSINKISEYSNNNISLSYIVKNDINKKDYQNTSYKAEEIYVVSNLNLYKYYVKGSFYKEVMDMVPEYIKDEYFVLNYDMENRTYNIELINEKKYNNASNEEYKFESISKNEYNDFVYSNLNNKSRALMYFNDYLNKMYYNQEEAYSLLTNETKNNYFLTINEFKNYINNKNFSMKEFSVEKDRIGIKDNYDNEFIFEISYILKYKVTINKTEE